MVRFEIKKVFSTFGSKVAVVLLTLMVLLSSYLAIIGVVWVNEQGDKEIGFGAIAKLKQAQSEWEGELNEEKLRAIFSELQRISETPEAQSQDNQQIDIAYSWKQGVMPIRNMMNYAYAPNFNTYDYYLADSIKPEEATDFYTNRVKLLKDYLYTGDGKNYCSETEKEYLIRQYEEMKTPIYYEYTEGWNQLLEYSSTVITIAALILGYLVAGIFSNEFRWKSDAIFFTTIHGRNSGVSAKIKAGFWIITGLYWSAIVIYTLITLGILGFDGAGCVVQLQRWKCFYNLTFGQTYLLVVFGGYIANLFCGFMTMWVSAKSRSSLFAVTVPFLLIFIPNILANMDIEWLNRAVGLFPDQLMQVYVVMWYFNIYEIFGKVFSAMELLLPLYTVLTILLVPLMYREYRTKQIG